MNDPCCDFNKSNQDVPSAPEFEKPYNFIPSCNSCGSMFEWVDLMPPAPIEIPSPVIVTQRNTRNGN
jgi:hypothetical protein